MLVACSEVEPTQTRDDSGLIGVEGFDSITDSELFELLKSSFDAPSAFENVDIYILDDFGAALEEHEQWISVGEIASSLSEARELVDADAEFIGENDYYYAFSLPYYRILVHKDSVIGTEPKEPPYDFPGDLYYYTMRSRDTRVIRDLLDIQLYIDYHSQSSPGEYTTIVHRSLEATESAFVYSFFVVEINSMGVHGTAEYVKYSVTIDKESGRYDRWLFQWERSVINEIEYHWDGDVLKMGREEVAEYPDMGGLERPLERPKMIDLDSLEFIFAETAPSHIGNGFLLRRFELTPTGMVIDYVPGVPSWDTSGSPGEGFLIYEGNTTFDEVCIFLDAPLNGTGRRYTVSNDLSRFIRSDDWQGIRFTVVSNEEIGDFYRDTIAFNASVDFSNWKEIHIGSNRIYSDFDYAFDTRKLIKPAGLSKLDSELYEAVAYVNREIVSIIRNLEAVDFEEASDAWIAYKIEDVKKRHYELYSEGFGFDPEMYGEVIENKYIEPPWAGGFAGDSVVFLGSRTNADKTITLTVVRGIAPNHGDERIIVVQNLRDNGEHVEFDELVLGYRCPFDGQMYYYPQKAEELPKVEYTFVKEGNKHKILRIETK